EVAVSSPVVPAIPFKGVIGRDTENSNPQLLVHRLIHPHGASGIRPALPVFHRCLPACTDRASSESLRDAAFQRMSPACIYLDTYMLRGVYQANGICVRNHCGAEPPRDIEPPDLVTTVGERDRDLSQPGSRTCSSSSRRKRAAMIPCLPKYPTTWPGSFRSTTGKRPILLSNIFAEASCKAS